MDLHAISCPHGHGFWHLFLDIWWAVGILALTPFYYFKGKIFKK